MTRPEIYVVTYVLAFLKTNFSSCLEIDLDESRTWCPRAGCETVCLVGPGPEIEASTSAAIATTTTAMATDANGALLCAVQCPSCKDKFCSACKKTVTIKKMKFSAAYIIANYHFSGIRA